MTPQTNDLVPKMTLRRGGSFPLYSSHDILQSILIAPRSRCLLSASAACGTSLLLDSIHKDSSTSVHIQPAVARVVFPRTPPDWVTWNPEISRPEPRIYNGGHGRRMRLYTSALGRICPSTSGSNPISGRFPQAPDTWVPSVMRKRGPGFISMSNVLKWLHRSTSRGRHA
ncbi:hypothetical protein CPB85DRAFT_201593 [Mucidula mucida]|nr:hypothetical protein CPB85DRAFT_201593 [Mucidula mucida]